MRNALALWSVVLLAGCENVVDKVPESGPLATAFQSAARDTGVPRDVLVGVAWVQTRFHEGAHHDELDGEHAPPRIGFMGLPPERAAAAVAPAEGIMIAAQLLAEYAGAQQPKSIEGWRTALARYAAPDDLEAGRLFADAVLDVVQSGIAAPAFTGEVLVIDGRGKTSSSKAQALVAGADSELVARYLPARAGHWHSGRSRAVDRVVIHTTEGSYDGAISWFRSANNPYQTSAHYVIRSSDGEITQMVRERDTAYHVLNWNSRAIGIEHEAISANPAWFTDEMYRSSAALVRDICLRWGIPMDRAHIVGHREVPGNDHSDPGPHWNWDYFMQLVRDGADVPPPVDPCGGLDYAGVCDGATLTWCENGRVRNADCAATGEACGWENDQVGNNCIAGAPPPPPEEPVQQEEPNDPCGGVDYAGYCDGTTLVWCESATLRSFECSSTGEVCGWESDDVGNNCVPPPPEDPCQGESWHGRCEENTLIWCEDNVVRTYECRQCGWQNDDVGNNCL